ncbi:MAG: ABC transporter ATP-binding protein [Myxococcales bacterium]
MSGTPLLEVVDLNAWYGQSHVLHGISFSVGRGETVSLMGRNGMGKTTTVRSLFGLSPPRRQGAIRFGGQPLGEGQPHRVARAGMALVPEGRGIFPNLSVRENLVLAERPGPGGRRAWTLARVLETFPRLAQRLDHGGSQLSGGEQQMLSIGRALLTNPDLLVLDGATEGLAPLVRREIHAVLGLLRADGTATLVIDKDVEPLLRIADRHLVLVKGRIVFCGSSAEIRARSDEVLAHLRV